MQIDGEQYARFLEFGRPDSGIRDDAPGMGDALRQAIEEMRAAIDAAGPVNYADPENWHPAYVALYSVDGWSADDARVRADPQPADEVRGVGYRRQPITAVVLGIVDGTLTVANAERIEWRGDLATWAQPITHLGITDADGRILKTDPMPVERWLSANDHGVVLEGLALTLTLDKEPPSDAPGQDGQSENPFSLQTEPDSGPTYEQSSDSNEDADSGRFLSMDDLTRYITAGCPCPSCRSRRKLVKVAALAAASREYTASGGK